MIGQIAKRALIGLLIVFAATSAMFYVANKVGDPAAAALGPNASPDARAAWRHARGYDRPLAERYGRFLWGIVTLDLGRSDADREPVFDVIMNRLPRTLLLSGMALSFEIGFGLLLGVLAALRRGTFLDTGFMGLAFLGISVPTFVSGPLFLLAFAFRLGWFPVGGYGVTFWDHVQHALLPAFTLAIIGAATYARVMRSEMIDTMQSDYIRTARAKGLHPFQVVTRHGVRNALLPIVTLIGLSFPLLFSGAIITEHIYNWPGMGRLALQSITLLDIPMIMGVVVFAAIFVQLGNLLADVAVALLDPRVRMDG